MESKKLRADRTGAHRAALQKNKKRLLATSDVCAICGQPIDKSLKYPDTMAASVDHIVPVSKNGHPSAIENLQLVHWICNRKKSDKLISSFVASSTSSGAMNNNNLEHTIDWTAYKSEND